MNILSKMSFAAIATLIGVAATSPAQGQTPQSPSPVATYKWTVTAPKDVNSGTSYSVTNVAIDVTVEWSGTLTPVGGIDVEVWVNGINRTGNTNNFSYTSPTATSKRLTGSQAVNTQNVNSQAVVKFFAKDAAGTRINDPTATKEVTIQLKP